MNIRDDGRGESGTVPGVAPLRQETSATHASNLAGCLLTAPVWRSRAAGSGNACEKFDAARQAMLAAYIEMVTSGVPASIASSEIAGTASAMRGILALLGPVEAGETGNRHGAR